MRKLCKCLLMAGVLAGSVQAAEAVEFKAQGEWLFGWGGVESTLVKNNNGGNDVFDARQRLRLQMEAVASESLSGVLRIQIGDISWGKNEDGGALGTDGKIIKVRDAYIDWVVPNTDLRWRMGLQGVALPNAAGGSSVLDEQTAAVVGTWKFNETAGLTAFWLRPFNDNYAGYANSQRVKQTESANMLDNADYFGLSVPLHFEGMEVTPWVMLGMVGRNSLQPVNADGEEEAGPVAYYNMPLAFSDGMVRDGSFKADRAYATQFYVGLPLSVTLFDPWNFELDLNYGYSSGFGNYSVVDRLGTERRADSQRQGWLAKGLVEYKLDFGTPGLFGWYASGDDGDVSNGSERMPSVAPSANFTSFMQDGPDGWSLNGGYDLMMTYAGTWGLGAQLRDVSFLENMAHTFRVVYWGGTNSPAMTKQSAGPQSWRQDTGLYLTTLDHMWEINVDTRYQIYENLEAVVELGYIVNGIDREQWRKYSSETSYQNADGWKAALVMRYTF